MKNLQTVRSTGRPDPGSFPPAVVAGIAETTLKGARAAWRDPAVRAAYRKWRNYGKQSSAATAAR